jgi:hypothetical protein
VGGGQSQDFVEFGKGFFPCVTGTPSTELTCAGESSEQASVGAAYAYRGALRANTRKLPAITHCRVFARWRAIEVSVGIAAQHLAASFSMRIIFRLLFLLLTLLVHMHAQLTPVKSVAA